MEPHSSLSSTGAARPGSSTCGSRKRPRLVEQSLFDSSSAFDPSANRENPFGDVDPLEHIQLYAIQDDFTLNPLAEVSHATLDPQLQAQFLSSSSDDFYSSFLSTASNTNTIIPSSDWSDFPILSDHVVLEAAIPSASARTVPLNLANPFADNASNRISHICTTSNFAPQESKVNSYLKLKICLPTSLDDPGDWQPRRFRRSDGHPRPTDNKAHDQTTISQEHVKQALGLGPEDNVSRLPPDFGLGCKLTAVEHKLLRFYVHAWCSGRTLLPQSNCWKIDVAPMLTGSECVRNAIFSLACSYILDYKADDRLRLRCNDYYLRAVNEIGLRMTNSKEWEVGKGDDLVSAFTLLNMHDVVNWEHRRTPDHVPRWFQGAHTASKILDATDPGYRYYKPCNVQVTRARMSNAINCGRLAIHGLLFTPLDIANTKDSKFGWLLYGSEADVRKIHGASGYCPKILHIIGQVTHLAAKFTDKPDPAVTPILANVLLTRLQRIVQWSEISVGYETTEEQLAACKLTEEGLVDTAGEFTQLNAECWKLSAQLYLICRLQRFRRNHPTVLRKLDLLSDCMNRMPCTGRLFTSQSPFVPAFLLGFVSVQDRHRNAARHWFETVISVSQCRSSVPPIWSALQTIWEWMDENIIDPIEEQPDAIERREPWWEKVVARLMETGGTIAVT